MEDFDANKQTGKMPCEDEGTWVVLSVSSDKGYFPLILLQCSTAQLYDGL